MKEFDRWFSTAALIAAMLPLVLIAVMFRVYPDGFDLVISSNAADTESTVLAFDKLRLFYLGLFCIIPLVFAVFARMIKQQKKQIINFKGIVLGSLVLSTVYIAVVLFVLFSPLLSGGMLGSLEPLPFILCTFCLVVSLCANLLYRLAATPVPGFKRAAGDFAHSVWRKLRARLTSLTIYWYLIMGVTVAFMTGLAPLWFTLIGGFLHYLVFALYAYLYLLRRKKLAAAG